MAIVALCIVVFPFAYYPAVKANARVEEIETRVVPKVRGHFFAKYVVEGRSEGRYLSDQPGFWRAWEAGEIAPKGSEDFQAWRKLQRDLEAARQADPFTRFGFVPARPRPWTLVTSLFLHGDWLHLLFNMLFLYLVACNIEYRWGRPTFVAFYLTGGVAASLAHASTDWSSEIPCVGASGAIAAVMGAFMVRHAWARVRIAYLLWAGATFTRHGTFHLPAWVAAGLWFAGQAVLAPVATWIGPQVLPVAVWAHVGGFVFGILVAVAVRWTPLERWVEDRRRRSPGWRPPPEKADLETGIRFLEEGHPMQALRFLREVVERDPKDLVAREGLVEALIQAGSIDETRVEMEKLMGILGKRGDREAALAKAAAFLERRPGESLEPARQILVARWFEEAGDHAHARAAYRALADSHPDHVLAPKALYRAGEIETERLGEPAEGSECFRALVERYPASPLCSFARKRLGGAE